MTEEEIREQVKDSARPKITNHLVELATENNRLIAKLVEIGSSKMDELKAMNKRDEITQAMYRKRTDGVFYLGIFAAVTSVANISLLIVGLVFHPEETKALFQTLASWGGL